MIYNYVRIYIVVYQDAVRQRLIGVSRVFAASATDIPAHRRTRMASAISRAIGTDNVWIVACVLLEGYVYIRCVELENLL